MGYTIMSDKLKKEHAKELKEARELRSIIKDVNDVVLPLRISISKSMVIAQDRRGRYLHFSVLKKILEEGFEGFPPDPRLSS